MTVGSKDIERLHQVYAEVRRKLPPSWLISMAADIETAPAADPWIIAKTSGKVSGRKWFLVHLELTQFAIVSIDFMDTGYPPLRTQPTIDAAIAYWELTRDGS